MLSRKHRPIAFEASAGRGDEGFYPRRNPRNAFTYALGPIEMQLASSDLVHQPCASPSSSSFSSPILLARPALSSPREKGDRPPINH